jgi:hypothetical protein
MKQILIIALLVAVAVAVAAAQNNDRDSFIPADFYIGIESALVNLQITGGLGSFENKRRKGNLGWLSLATSLASRQTTGHLFLTF